jgi:hypothetical protein
MSRPPTHPLKHTHTYTHVAEWGAGKQAAEVTQLQQALELMRVRAEESCCKWERAYEEAQVSVASTVGLFCFYSRSLLLPQ